MVAENIAKQIIDFQKAAFDNTFNATVMVQDQAERLFNSAVEQAAWMPEESKRLFDEWIRMAKVGRNDFKSIVDDNFTRLAEFLDVPSAAPRAAAPKTKQS